MNESISSKDYKASRPRLCLTVAEERLEKEKREIRCPKEIEKIILENVQQTFDFVAYELPDIKCSAREETGLLWRRFLLSHVRLWCGLSEADDDLILSALDGLAKKGKLKIFNIQLTRDTNINDCGFCSELGKGKRTVGYTDIELNVERLYSKKPLGKGERDEYTILDVKATVEKIRQQRDRHFEQRFGKIDFNIERQLHREDLIEEARFRDAVLVLANDIKKREARKKEESK